MTTSTLTRQERWNAAVQGIREAGITVVLGHEGGMEYKSGDRIAWTDADPISSARIIFNQIGDLNSTGDEVAKQFEAQGFEVASRGWLYGGVVINL